MNTVTIPVSPDAIRRGTAIRARDGLEYRVIVPREINLDGLLWLRARRLEGGEMAGPVKHLRFRDVAEVLD